jgi:ATP synthase protein I
LKLTALPPRPDRLEETVRRHRERRERAVRDRGHSIGRDLAQIGVLGWTVVTPALLGILAGRWLDRRWATGILWTLGLLCAGLVFGCFLGWRRLTRS